MTKKIHISPTGPMPCKADPTKPRSTAEPRRHSTFDQLSHWAYVGPAKSLVCSN